MNNQDKFRNPFPPGAFSQNQGNPFPMNTQRTDSQPIFTQNVQSGNPPNMRFPPPWMPPHQSRAPSDTSIPPAQLHQPRQAQMQQQNRPFQFQNRPPPVQPIFSPTNRFPVAQQVNNQFRSRLPTLPLPRNFQQQVPSRCSPNQPGFMPHNQISPLEPNLGFQNIPRHIPRHMLLNQERMMIPPSFVPRPISPVMTQQSVPSSVINTAFNPMTPPVSDIDDMKDEYKNVMTEVVDTWLKAKNTVGKTESKGTDLLQIHEYKDLMKSYVLTIDKLRLLNDSLAEHMEADVNTWNKLIEGVNKVKHEVISMQVKLFNEEQVKSMPVHLKLRKKKRDRIKRSKQKHAAQYVASLTQRIKLNEEIDDWQQKQQTKIIMEKMVENLKNEAGESLVEVKRKQTEAIEFIEIFTLLKELREIRKETAIYKGILVTEKVDEAFNSKIDDVIQLLTRQKKIYEDEERALRVLREEEAEELNRMENEKRKRRKQSRQQDISLMDPMFTFRLYWLQGEESIAGLMHVRNLWDMYLCPPDSPVGSRLPKGWIDPSSPSNKQWEKYLVKPKFRKRKSELGT